MENGSLLEVCGVSEMFLRDSGHSGPEAQVKLGEGVCWVPQQAVEMVGNTQ